MPAPSGTSHTAPGAVATAWNLRAAREFRTVQPREPRAMRIAVPVTDGRIPNHLGHCQSFLFVDAEGGRVRSERELPNPGHGPLGPPPRFVASQGVDCVLAWGMPPHARELFAQAGIRVQLGANGDARRAVRDFLAGTIELTTEALDAGGGCGHGPPEIGGHFPA